MRCNMMNAEAIPWIMSLLTLALIEGRAMFWCNRRRNFTLLTWWERLLMAWFWITNAITTIILVIFFDGPVKEGVFNILTLAVLFGCIQALSYTISRLVHNYKHPELDKF